MLLFTIKPRSLVKARFVSKTAPAVHINNQPSCKDCKWAIDNGKICMLFSLTDNLFETKLIRKSNDLCGPDGFYFKPKQI